MQHWKYDLFYENTASSLNKVSLFWCFAGVAGSRCPPAVFPAALERWDDVFELSGGSWASPHTAGNLYTQVRHTDETISVFVFVMDCWIVAENEFCDQQKILILRRFVHPDNLYKWTQFMNLMLWRRTSWVLQFAMIMFTVSNNLFCVVRIKRETNLELVLTTNLISAI